MGVHSIQATTHSIGLIGVTSRDRESIHDLIAAGVMHGKHMVGIVARVAGSADVAAQDGRVRVPIALCQRRLSAGKATVEIDAIPKHKTIHAPRTRYVSTVCHPDL